ncbi:hypothetical protein Pelo_5078 [Pelomyxa schiedti]|nr:hypothetical protein Pelo_5078 [Pelomyxa schiedti]
MITFGVSPVLMTLTQDMRWWVQRRRYTLLGANQRWSQSGSNGKWLVHCEASSKEIVFAALPNGPGSVHETAVPSAYNVSELCFVENCKDQVLLCCCDSFYHYTAGQLVLVDLEQTRQLKKLAVLSVTTCPDWDGTGIFLGSHLVLNTQTGVNVFLPMASSIENCPLIEEGTSKVHNIIPRITMRFQSGGAVSQLNGSHFCVFGWDFYEVWAVNDLSDPVRTHECPRGCTTEQAFVEGGLVFQMSKSKKEMHVTDEYSGANIVTLRFFTPLSKIIRHFSFLH